MPAGVFMTTTHARSNRFAWGVLILAVVAAPLVALGAVRALKSTSNDPRQWLPQDFAETDTYDWFQQHFGSDEFAVVSWPGCNLDDPRVPRLADALGRSPQFDRVLSGRSVVSELMGPPLRMSRAAAVARLRGILVHPQQETSCLILSTSAVGRADRIAAVATIEQQAARVGGLAKEELKLAGPTVDAAAIDKESRRLLFGLAGFSALISFCAAAFRLGSLRVAIMVLSVAIYSTGLSLALLYFSGGEMNLLMTMLPPLIYVLSISSAVHLANYYRDAVDHPSITNPLQVAISHGWLPCCLAAATTAIGLVSLSMSKIEPIRMFGVFSALGVIVSVAVLFLLLPAALRLFPPKFPTSDRGPAQPAAIGKRMVALIGRHHFLLLSSCLVLMAACGWRLPAMKSTVKLQDRFLSSSDEIADYRWLEDNVGPMVPLEVVVHFARDDPRGLVEQLWVVAAIQAKIQTLEEPVATMSAVNFCPPLPRGESVGAVIQRKVIGSPHTRQRLTAAKFLADQSGERLWRITVRAARHRRYRLRFICRTIADERCTAGPRGESASDLHGRDPVDLQGPAATAAGPGTKLPGRVYRDRSGLDAGVAECDGSPVGDDSQSVSRGGGIRRNFLGRDSGPNRVRDDSQRRIGNCGRRHRSLSHLVSSRLGRRSITNGCSRRGVSAVRGSDVAHDSDLFLRIACVRREFVRSDPALRLADGVLAAFRTGRRSCPLASNPGGEIGIAIRTANQAQDSERGVTLGDPLIKAQATMRRGCMAATQA